ncbi:MAG: surface polysaccharide O-acyltransferase-like enzyme [Pirellulaceae bacterium]|jgi:surface polysaccharide O-acyltransferase-like enzyme
MSTRDRGLLAFMFFNISMVVYQMFLNPYSYDLGYLFRIVVAVVVSSLLAGAVFFVTGLMGE